MRKRNVHIQFWLNRKEAESLDKKVRRSGLSREAYLRHLIDGVVPQDAPPPDYFSMMRELYGIANNLNQIAQKAHTLNVVDVQRYYHFVNAEDEAAFDEFIAECKALALYDTGVTAEYGDKLITLSTCEYSRTNGRMVIVAKLVVPSAEEVDADAGH